MNQGKLFEKDFEKSIPKDIKLDRLKDPSVSYRYNNDKNIEDKSVRFAYKNPYDYILYKRPEQICLELKTTGKKLISFDGVNPDIKKHQIKGLSNASKYCNAGFLINFRDSNKTYYLPIENFNIIIKRINKKSFNEKDIKDYSFLIPCKKLRKRYRYDINYLFKIISNT